MSLVTTDQELVHWPTLELFRPNRTLKKDTLLRHVQLKRQIIQSVSLRAGHVITTKAVLPFDFLILDQTPVYTQSELKTIRTSVQSLALHTNVPTVTTTAAVRVKGKTVSGWQLALAIKNWLVRQRYNHVAVEVEPPAEQKVQQFLEANGIICRLSRRPGLTVAQPPPMIDTRRIKGLIVDESGQAITDAHALAKSRTNVLIRDNRSITRRNLFRAEQTVAHAWCNQVNRLVEGQPPRAVEADQPALVLDSSREVLAMLGATITTGLRAQAVLELDKVFFAQLLRRHH